MNAGLVGVDAPARSTTEQDEVPQSPPTAFHRGDDAYNFLGTPKQTRWTCPGIRTLPVQLGKAACTAPLAGLKVEPATILLAAGSEMGLVAGVGFEPATFGL